jgi:type IV secretion system protein VirB10
MQSNAGDDGDDPILVSGPKRLQLTNAQKIGVAGLVAFVFLAFIWIDHALQSKDADNRAELSMRPTAAAFRPAPMNLAPIEAATPTPGQPAGADKEMSAAGSPIFAFSGGLGNTASTAASTIASAIPSARQIVPSLASSVSDGGTSLSSKLKPTATLASKAVLLPHPDMLITKGTIIPCTLATAIDTELAGFVKCTLPEAVRGTTGNVVLLDRGTTIVGEIQAGLSQGQKRVFILWDRVETPQHAIISLASPGADELGRAGVTGSVNNHFWDRFGAALMLSIVQGGLQAGTELASNAGSNGGTYVNSFQSNGQQLADTALSNTMNIPPSLQKNQGGNVSIFVAKDIDFSDIYRLDVSN